ADWELLSPPDMKYHDYRASLYEIEPVAGTVEDSQFTDALTHRCDITEVTRRQSVNPGQASCPCPPVLEGLEPLRELCRLPDFQHLSTIVGNSHGCQPQFTLRLGCWHDSFLCTGPLHSQCCNGDLARV